MVLLAQGEGTREKAMCRMRRALEQGSALEKFQDIIAAQGGDPGVVDNTRLLPEAGMSKIVAAGEKGYVRSLQADEIGKAAMLLGAGRRKKDDPIDFSAGIMLHKKVGDPVSENEPLATLYYNFPGLADRAGAMVKKAFKISEASPDPEPLILDILK